MSTVSSVNSSSSAAAYATQLAQTSQLERSLYNLGTAVQQGNLTSAGATLTALMQANPQYASNSTGSTDSSDQSDPVNAAFQSLSTAIGNNDTNGAKAAWQQLNTALSQQGITVSNSAASTAKILANANESLDASILTQTFGAADASSPLDGLIGESSSGDALSSVLSNWVMYKATGSVAPAAPSTTGATLSTTA